MRINGQSYGRTRCLRLLEALRLAEESMWQKARFARSESEHLSVLPHRNEIAAFIGDLKADIRDSAEAETEEVHTE